VTRISTDRGLVNLFSFISHWFIFVTESLSRIVRYFYQLTDFPRMRTEQFFSHSASDHRPVHFAIAHYIGLRSVELSLSLKVIYLFSSDVLRRTHCTCLQVRHGLRFYLIRAIFVDLSQRKFSTISEN